MFQMLKVSLFACLKLTFGETGHAFFTCNLPCKAATAAARRLRYCFSWTQLAHSGQVCQLCLSLSLFRLSLFRLSLFSLSLPLSPRVSRAERQGVY